MVLLRSSGAALLAATIALPVAAQGSTGPLPGVVSYWSAEAGQFDQLPDGALALVNPDSGLFVASGQSFTPVADLASVWRPVVDRARARGVRLLGYVPTGYFRHDCNKLGVCQTWARIEAQVASYFTQLPGVSGIFFDETAPTAWSCNAFAAEYARLRALVAKYRPGAAIAFNPGVADACVLGGLQAGETVVLFEGSSDDYATQAATVRGVTQLARARGLQPWHLVHTARTATAMTTAVTRAKQAQAALLHVTDVGGNWQAGENTWGAPPLYWADLVRTLLPTPPGSSIGTVGRRLVGAASQLCLHGSGTRVEQQPCTTASPWQLALQRGVDGRPWYQLRYGSRCATQPEPGRPTLTWSACNASAAAQLWALRPHGALYRFENRLSGQMLTLPPGPTGSTASAENPLSTSLRQQFQLR